MKQNITMKAIFSFKKLKTDHYKPIDDNFFKLAKLSVQMAKIHYKTEFYGDEESYKLFEDKGVVFDNVNLLDSIKNYNGDITSYSKLMAMLEQKEPYICLDFDTLLFERIETTSTITFGYPEIVDYSLHNILSQDDVSSYIEYIEKYYKRHLSKYKHKLSNIQNVYLDTIPNYSLFAVKNTVLIKNIIKDIFNKFSTDELEEMGAMFIEQYLIYCYLKNYQVDCNYIYTDTITEIHGDLNTFGNKFHHYIDYYKDENFNDNIQMIADSYNISLKLKEKLL